MGPATKAVEVLDVLGDEEHLPFPPESFDLVVRYVCCVPRAIHIAVMPYLYRYDTPI